MAASLTSRSAGSTRRVPEEVSHNCGILPDPQARIQSLDLETNKSQIHDLSMGVSTIRGAEIALDGHVGLIRYNSLADPRETSEGITMDKCMG